MKIMKKLTSTLKLNQLFATNKLEENEQVILQGWVKTNRNNGSVGFIELNDGSQFKNIQLVYTKEKVTDFTKFVFITIHNFFTS